MLFQKYFKILSYCYYHIILKMTIIAINIIFYDDRGFLDVDIIVLIHFFSFFFLIISDN